MRRKMLLLFVFLACLLTKNAGAAGTIGLPFSEGEAWYACQGYDGTISHSGAPVLDLSVDPASPGPTGCYAGENASTGRTVIAPWKGKVSFFGRSDMVCVTRDDGLKSMAIGHLDPETKRPVGDIINLGDRLGILAAPNTLPPEQDGNGNYAHIHVQGHEGAGCIGSLVPFDDAHGMRFEGDVPDMTWDKTIPNQWSRTKLTRAAASTHHPNGTLVKTPGGTLYRVESGKVRYVAQSYLPEQELVSISSEEFLCYKEGLAYDGTSRQDWQGFPEGSLIQQSGDYKVYVVSEGKPRWLNLNENEFVSFGYKWENIKTVNISFVPGDSLSVVDFKRCENPWMYLGGIMHAVLTGYVGGGFQDMPNDYSGGNPPPPPDQTLAGNNMLFAARFYDAESLQGFSSAGVKLWSVRGTGEVAFDGVDIIAIGCDDVYKTLVHIDPASGAIKSSFRLAFDGDIGNCGTRSQMSLWSDRLYILSPSGNFLYAIRKSDGALLWKRASGYGWESDKFFDAGFAPTVSADGTVYLARENGSLVAVNVDGTIKWEKNLGGNNFPPKVGPDGTIFYVLYDTAYGYVYAFSPDGSQKWQAVKETGLILKAADSNGIYVRSGSLLISLDPVNGNEKFRQDIGSWESLLTGTNGTIYVPRDGYVLALSPTTGQELGRYVSSEFNHVSTSLTEMSGGSIAAVTGTSPLKVSFLEPVALPPIAEAQSVSATANTPVEITLIGWGPNWEPVTFAIASAPSHGTLGAIAANNRYSVKVVYTPAPGFFGSDSFTFRTNDGVGYSAAATVSVTVR